jgi:hypothetical protein
LADIQFRGGFGNALVPAGRQKGLNFQTGHGQSLR